MGMVGCNQRMVAGTKMALRFALNAETCRAGEKNNPFVMPLTMGFISRRGLTR
jgi:hypothetical protein